MPLNKTRERFFYKPLPGILTAKNMTSKKTLLENLYKKFLNCTQCPLGNLGRNNIVFGSGNPDSHIMLIGEGPGEQEDRTGKPFIGRSGQLLTKLLAIAGIDRNSIFISNIVKCRPPENRKPTPIEIATCTNLLLFEQIKIINPLVIGTLGATALEGFCTRPVKITKERGLKILWNNIPLIPTFHPAYLLRNPSSVGLFVDDLIQIENLSRSLLP
jgi:DNA polymerase